MARISLRNPFTGSRISITRPSQKQAHEVAGKIARTLADMRDGHLTVALGLERVAELQYGRVRAVLVDTVFADYLATQTPSNAKRLASYWANHYAKAFAGRHPMQLTEDVMRAWYSDGLSELLETTRHTVFAILKAAVNLAVRTDRIPHLPWKSWRPPPARARARGAATNAEQVEALIAAAHAVDVQRWPELYSDLSYRVALFIMTGLRQGELAALGWDHVFFHEDAPHVFVEWQALGQWRTCNPTWTRPQSPTKGREQKKVPLSETCVHLLLAQRAQLERVGLYRPDGPVFPGVGGQWRAQPVVVDPERMRELARAAGLADADKWVTHSTRHTFVTMTARSSRGNLAELMTATGHKSLEQLAGYMHEGRGLTPEAYGRQLFLPMPLPPNVIPIDRAAATQDATAAAVGAPRVRSAEDQAEAGRRYQRAYARALRRTGSGEDARAAGKRAKEGFWRAWEREVHTPAKSR